MATSQDQKEKKKRKKTGLAKCNLHTADHVFIFFISELKAISLTRPRQKNKDLRNSDPFIVVLEVESKFSASACSSRRNHKSLRVWSVVHTDLRTPKQSK